MKQNKTKKHSAIALFSGGLDSLLVVKYMEKLGYTIYPVYFATPYMPAQRALEAALDNGINLIVRDISSEHIEMMESPVYGFGKNLNPCIDCHGLMFRIAGEMLEELGADFIISGEVMGQRPMSQRKDALNMVAKLSGYKDLLVRPLSQKLLEDTLPITQGWVDKDDMLDISGRGRNRQLELAKELGIKNFPSPAGGCLLTDKGFSQRIKDLQSHNQFDERNLELLRFGRHFRLDDRAKLIVGRNMAENASLSELSEGLITLKAAEHIGPFAVLNSQDIAEDVLRLALDIFWYYHPKAPDEGKVLLYQPDGSSLEYQAKKTNRETVEKHMLNIQK
ncbi:MAG TPA: tRNA (5-methylaminomethyl-2-thiouridylate)-methyltransferase [Candidatus Cloacimonetes bacterium]|nr:tRNA (5-methylaminomethyl-2-thiouridylate)-methyltransferase [Candidatus Cloacimonadota bacterium]